MSSRNRTITIAPEEARRLKKGLLPEIEAKKLLDKVRYEKVLLSDSEEEALSGDMHEGAAGGRETTHKETDSSKVGTTTPELNSETPAHAIPDTIINKQIAGDSISILKSMPDSSIDLIFADPPYNMQKEYSTKTWSKLSEVNYIKWLKSWIVEAIRILKSDGSIYICSDWSTGCLVLDVLSEYATIRNRITFEREKGRGSARNWKNNSEDIYFATKSDIYHFDVEAVKLRKSIIAPYRIDGKPKGWKETKEGKFRLTHPSNIWADITIPFWSMRENTPHPTQKPEKLLAKVILASSKAGDIVLDPFSGSGTTGVVAKKLGRRFIMIEQEQEYCLYAMKRLEMAEENQRIQGYSDGAFHERNM